jgi:hypothetical protein
MIYRRATGENANVRLSSTASVGNGESVRPLR